MSKRQDIRLSFGQLFTLWGIVAGMMVVVFFFGLHAGMDQGLRKALDEQEAAVVRLPILPNPTAQASVAPMVPVQAPVASAAGTDEKFDFSGMVIPPVGSVPPVADTTAPKVLPAPTGMASRPTQEVLASSTLTGTSASTTPPPGSVSTDRTEPPPPAIQAPEKKSKPETKSALVPVAKSVVKPNPEISERIVRGYYVQVVAPSSRAEAVQVVKRLSNSGIVARVQETKVNGVLHYRVLAGPSKNRDGAEKLRSRVARTGGIKGKPFVRQID